MKFEINTNAKTAEKIVVEASVDCDGYLDFEPDGIDSTFELLDVEVIEGYNAHVSKLYKVPSNDIFVDGFTVVFTYSFEPSDYGTLYFPADFQTSAYYIKDFDDVRRANWVPEDALIYSYGGDVDYTRFLAEDYGYDDDEDE